VITSGQTRERQKKWEYMTEDHRTLRTHARRNEEPQGFLDASEDRWLKSGGYRAAALEPRK